MTSATINLIAVIAMNAIFWTGYVIYVKTDLRPVQMLRAKWQLRVLLHEYRILHGDTSQSHNHR